MSVREHNERMFKLSEKNRETPAFNVRQYSNPFMLASTQSLLTQLVAKGGVAAVPTTSASMGTVSEPFVETSTTKAEAEPSAGESTFAEEAAKVFLSSEEKAEAADEARHVAHQAYKENKKQYAKESEIVKATLPAGWSLKNSPEQLAAKLAESTAAYKESQVDGTNKLIDQMEEKQMGTGNTRARKAPAMYAMLKHRLSMAEAHLKVMKQHNRDQVKAYKKTYASDNLKRAEGARLHKVYQDAHRMSRTDYAASYKAQKAASNIGRLKTVTPKLKAATSAAKASAAATNADAEEAVSTSKAYPETPDIPVNLRNVAASKDFATAVNTYRNRMTQLAKSLKPVDENESEAQLKRDTAELYTIRQDLARAQVNFATHLNSDIKEGEAGAFTKKQLDQYNALGTENKKPVADAVNKYTEARGDLIRYDAATPNANKQVPTVLLDGKTYTQRRVELKKSADAHAAYLTWAAEHQRLYQALMKTRRDARKSLTSQSSTQSTGKDSPELTPAEKGAATKADSKERASAEASAGDT